MNAVVATDITKDFVMTHPAVGRRQRLRHRFLSEEEAALTEEGLLELLLTFAIPQKDVRPLAGALLERFGSLQAVLGAGRKMHRKSRAQRFTVRLNSEQIIRRVGNLGNILSLTPKSMR